jgi:hypothetical protein
MKGLEERGRSRGRSDQQVGEGQGRGGKDFRIRREASHPCLKALIVAAGQNRYIDRA